MKSPDGGISVIVRAGDYESVHYALALAAAALAVAACGSEGIQLAEDDPNFEGARLFAENCAGCHSLSVVGAHGSATNIGSREPRDGPNFNERSVSVEDVLFAIRNGGFSSGPMPQNIVTGEEAQKVAEFVAEYAGTSRGDDARGTQ
jgi:mono/diheme cytochrome c family protein